MNIFLPSQYVCDVCGKFDKILVRLTEEVNIPLAVCESCLRKALKLIEEADDE